MKNRSRMAALMAAVLLPLLGASAALAGYPDKPIHLIHGYATGGSTDILARLVADKLSADFGQPVVVEARAGAGGNIAMDAVAKARADGYTMLMATGANFAINPVLYKKLPFDVRRDFQPVSQVVTVGNVLVVHPSLPITSVPELIQYAKANPGKLVYGSSGSGSLQHLSGELFQRMTGTKLVHAPYKGGSAARTDLLGGHISMMFSDLAVLPLTQNGKLRAIALTGSKREGAAAHLPTMSEALPGFVAESFYLVAMPAGTSADIVQRVSAAMASVLQKPDVKAKLQELGMVAAESTTPEFLTRALAADADTWPALIKAADIKIE